ncbi:MULTISPECIES: hypothetical protein [Bacteroides]|uniref:hypothetical protein n=1 Tax=Bacteroides TaxID=816 RepID=UPI0003078E0E|nr:MULTISPECIES: hypothetical protein [Bacteroides]KAA5449819.1 hypothetical protein F2Y48_10495 [Bacteroides caccae]KAA5454287.1 hypothetical protein F2Y38_06275 [Bacteroides caccae]KAA5460809.1 hypothetical protein F2Y50_05755 [Bacteroides caccae]KAA5475646.1 hypothetical protein F2Y34_03815 [Bacteroides caccae]MBT9861255.1 hypothetical protein [Bacteroides xylanisolvens]
MRKKNDVNASLYRQGHGGQGRIYPGARRAFVLSFKKRLFAVTCGSGACVASTGYSNVPRETLGYFLQFLYGI